VKNERSEWAPRFLAGRGTAIELIRFGSSLCKDSVDMHTSVRI
jgi:hypothetical protein